MKDPYMASFLIHAKIVDSRVKNDILSLKASEAIFVDVLKEIAKLLGYRPTEKSALLKAGNLLYYADCNKYEEFVDEMSFNDYLNYLDTEEGQKIQDVCEDLLT